MKTVQISLRTEMTISRNYNSVGASYEETIELGEGDDLAAECHALAKRAEAFVWGEVKEMLGGV